MSRCPLKRNADGFLECDDCNWIYKGKAESPRRNCPNSPDINTPEHREKIKQKMLAELKSLADEGRTVNSLATITERLDRCLTPCTRFNGHTCTFRGSACKTWKRWTEELALADRPCDRFEPTPEA